MQPCDYKIDFLKRYQVYKSMFHDQEEQKYHDRDFWKVQKYHDRKFWKEQKNHDFWKEQKYHDSNFCKVQKYHDSDF